MTTSSVSTRRPQAPASRQGVAPELPALLAVDVGNMFTKYRSPDGAFVAEPSLVRVAPDRASYALTRDVPMRPLTYVDGPAQLPSLPYLVGRDAARAGASEAPLIGTAEVRVQATPYLLLHLAAILASLPPATTDATIAFAGGVPLADFATPAVATLKARLKGTHTLHWGDTTYRITIDRILMVPQPIGGLATWLFRADGQPLLNGQLDRLRFGLDIGGGTTDFVGREGLKPVEGAEGGIPLGMITAADYARRAVLRRWPALRQLEVHQLLACYREQRRTLYVQGRPEPIGAELDAGAAQAADEILAAVLPHWQRRLGEGEVLLYGGGSADLQQHLRTRLEPLTTVELHPTPLFAVLDGLERMGRHQLGR